MSLVNFEDILNEELKDPEVKEYYEIARRQSDLAVSISESREEKGMTQRELASLVGVPQSTINRIETGKNVNTQTLFKVLNVLDKELAVI